VAVKDGNEWVINGTKIFITNGGPLAGFYSVLCQTDPAAEPAYRGISLILVEADRQKSRPILERALAGEPVVVEDFSGDDALERRYYEIANNPVRGAGGGVIGVAVFARDLTEHIQAEQQLQQSELRYRIVADNTHDWEFWLSPAGDFIYVSPSCETITGHAAEEFRRDAGLEMRLVHPADRDMLETHQRDTLEHKVHGECEYRILRPDGEICWIGHVCQPVFDAQGQYLGKRGSNRDITAQKQAEAALQRQAALLNALVNSPQETVALLDPQGNVLHINTNGAQRFGLTVEEMLGKNVYALLPEPLAGERKRIIDAGMRSGQPAHFEDQRQGIDFINSVNAVNDPQTGDLLGATVIAIDITLRKQAEDRIRQQIEELQRWYALTLDREKRILELKSEVNELLRRLDEPARYPSAAA